MLVVFGAPEVERSNQLLSYVKMVVLELPILPIYYQYLHIIVYSITGQTIMPTLLPIWICCRVLVY